LALSLYWLQPQMTSATCPTFSNGLSGTAQMTTVMNEALMAIFKDAIFYASTFVLVFVSLAMVVIKIPRLVRG
jgi:hypothetical protein